jgi:6-pyruvoyltetrahydropterin/6-carboxytetrahydropterin synthase
MRIGKTFTFAAAHMLPNHPGKCKTLHGHTYMLEVVVEGEVDYNNSGMVMDFKDLNQIVTDIVIDPYDHSYLNDRFDNPTAEYMVIKIFNDLNLIFHKSPHTLVKVKLWETPTSYAEVTNESV